MSLMWHPADAYMVCMNGHYHLDSRSLVKQLGVDQDCCALEVSCQLWADQYSLQGDNFKEVIDSGGKKILSAHLCIIAAELNESRIFRCKMCQRVAVQYLTYMSGKSKGHFFFTCTCCVSFFGTSFSQLLLYHSLF